MKPRRFHKDRFLRVSLLLLTLIVLGLSGFAGLSWYLKRNGGTVRNVILISIDTCRADHLNCYGFERPTTPRIDEIAGEGTIFTRARSPIPLTLPAHCSMLTGTYPPYHQVHDNVTYKLGASNVTLAEIL
ncbi:sulfatase-like hydrolase/transferase, partial [Planctomycetota bacterium]